MQMQKILENKLGSNKILLDMKNCTRYIEAFKNIYSSNYVGIDYHIQSKNYADSLAPIKNESSGIWSDIRQIGIADNSVDIITCINVL